MTFGSIAGSVTVSTSIGAILYYTIKNPKAYVKLMDEVRGWYGKSANLDPVAYADIQRMSYLYISPNPNSDTALTNSAVKP